jgi:hypothetical protein
MGAGPQQTARVDRDICHRVVGTVPMQTQGAQDPTGLRIDTGQPPGPRPGPHPSLPIDLQTLHILLRQALGDADVLDDSGRLDVDTHHPLPRHTGPEVAVA